MTAIDLGSNTIRFLNYDCDTKTETGSFEKVVRTAEGMHQSGLIDEEAITRIIEAVHEADRSIGLDQNVRATATAAFRNAKNRDHAIAAIQEATGIAFRVIDADEEARLAALALVEAAARCGHTEGLYILDIGGASTEIIYTDGITLLSKSFNVGIVTSANTYGENDMALVASLQPMLREIKTFTKGVEKEYGIPPLFAATAGTPTTLAALKQGMTYATYDKDKINGTVLSLRDINHSYTTLQNMDESLREGMVGSKRGDLVMCGVVIFREIFTLLGYSDCMVFDDGVREGIALAACKEAKKR